MAGKQLLKVNQDGSVTVVNLQVRRILEEPTIKAIAEQLGNLVEEGHRILLLNFSGVEYMSSAALGRFIGLHKKMSAVEGTDERTLAICNVIPQVFDVFAIAKLDKMFPIFPDEADALAALGSR